MPSTIAPAPNRFDARGSWVSSSTSNPHPESGAALPPEAYSGAHRDRAGGTMTGHTITHRRTVGAEGPRAARDGGEDGR